MTTIALVRHATPIMDYTGCTYSEAQSRLAQYNTVALVDESEIFPYADRLVSRLSPTSSRWMVSSSSRAVTTAERLLSEWEVRPQITIDSTYQEFALRLKKFPTVRLSVGAWFAWSRFTWLIGCNRFKPTCGQELRRAQGVCDELVKCGEAGITPVLVAHGLLNRFVGRSLEKYGYKKTEATKNGSFSIEWYERACDGSGRERHAGAGG